MGSTFQVPASTAVAQPIVPANDSASPAFVAQVIGDSKVAYGTATAPGAGAAVATLAAPGAGKYRIQVIPGYGGTADVLDNMQLQVGATVIGKLIVQPVANGAPVLHVFPRVDVPAGQAITVNAVAAGGVSTVFRAQIVATPVT